MMRRILLPAEDTARHRFLANLPPHVRGRDASATPPDKNWRLLPALTAEDVRSFLMAYCACLVAATTFLF